MSDNIEDFIKKAEDSIDAAQLLLEKRYNGFSVSKKSLN